MKKNLFLALIVVVGLSFTSCKKDYVCECEVTAFETTVPGASVTINDEREKNAQEICNDKEDELSTSQASVNCLLTEV